MNKEQMIQKIYEVICSDKIGWHEESCMIGDVLEFSDKLDKKGKRYWYTLCNRIIDLWKDKRKPIDEQSEECIKFVHSLLQ